MKKCEITPCCKNDEILTFQVDLRIDQAVRIKEIGETLPPQKDLLGHRHLCANITYMDNKIPKQVNLGAYIQENDTTQTVKIMFPASLTVNVLNQGAEEPINVLEYRIDKYTETVTEHSELAEMQDNPADSIFNYLKINTSLNENELKQSIDEQFTTFTDLTKPFVVQVSQNSRFGKITCYSYTYFANGDTTNLYIDISNSNITKTIGGRRLQLSFDKNSFINMTIGGTPGTEAIFLYEPDYDGVITTQDIQMSKQLGIPGNPWERLYNALKEKSFPAVYLKSQDSGSFCPAEYYFTPSESDPDSFEGTMKISYIKDGELHIETRDFTSLVGGINSCYNAQNLKMIQKFPLPPTPTTEQKDQYHVLCGDGIWRDIRTMINS